MYELLKLTENDFYVQCPAKVGIVKLNDNDVVLIDSGSDRDCAKKVLRIIEENSWNLKAIYNTHSHADHIGGNGFLEQRTGCKIYACDIECAYTKYPELEGIGLYGGFAFKELDNKFLKAQPSACQLLTQDVLPEGFEIINLNGHSRNMVGFITKDKTAFIADSLSSPHTLSKYGIGYLFDVENTLISLERLKSIDARVFVPSHAEVSSDIKDLIECNINAINKVINSILDICTTGCCFEDILQKVFEQYSLTMADQQYVLVGSTVRSYLSYLHGKNLLSFSFVNNRMIWQTVCLQ